MKKKRDNIQVESAETKKEYLGAEWIGPEGLDSEYGKLQKGKIYPVDEKRAEGNFKAVYRNEIKGA